MVVAGTFHEDIGVRVTRSDGLVLSDDIRLLDRTLIREWLAASYWAPTRRADVIDRSIDNSLSYGVYDGSTQIAFFRAVTDFSTFAWLCDVWVAGDRRGSGVGAWMIEQGVADLAARGVPRIALATLDAHDVYARAGFKPLTYPERWMDIDKRDVIP